MSQPTIQVQYSCKFCLLRKVKVNVVARAEGEDVVAWFRNTLTAAIAQDHAGRSPGCRSRTIEEVMIPINNDAPIGSWVKEQP